jgi:iron-sulfur cluster repair protein YtfE (RIC family)
MFAIRSTLVRPEFPSYARLFAAMHDAMRRDADRLVTAVDGQPDLPALARWFDRFEAVIEHHHHCEDEIVWPGLTTLVERGDCGDEGDAFLEAHHMLLDDHEELDGAMSAVRDALHGHSTIEVRRDAARRFQASLDVHLAREEAAVFPLLTRHVSEAEFHELEEAVVKTTPLSAMTFTVPWVIDGAAPDLAAEVQTGLPLPIRLGNRWVLQPRYRRIVAAATGVRS